MLGGSSDLRFEGMSSDASAGVGFEEMFRHLVCGTMPAGADVVMNYVYLQVPIGNSGSSWTR